MLHALNSDEVTPSGSMPEDWDSPLSLQESDTSPPVPPPSRTHVMFSVLAATSQEAFTKLQERLSLLSLYSADNSYETPSQQQGTQDSLAACSTALESLIQMRYKAFGTSNATDSTSQSYPVIDFFKAKDASQSQVSPWLRSYFIRAAIPQPSQQLTRYFLTFLVQAPQAYLDLVLPLLDQRLENPIGASSEDVLPELTREQALALDIYAHWSVLMFLVEEESWWIGKLPIITLTGMLNRYGDDFVARLWPECERGSEKWWPGSMLAILREIKRC